MKCNGVDPSHPEEPAGAPPTRRRSLLMGAGVVGAAAIAARALPTVPAAPAVATPAAKPAVDDKAGYQLTQHVLRYYETTRV